MKYYLSLITLSLFIFACTTQPKSKAEKLSSELVENVSGEFLFYDSAAVLNTGSKIYGLVVDDKLHKLNSQAVTLKKDSFDMVQVYIKGVISENPNSEGWPEVITVKEIDSVGPPVQLNNQIIEIRTE